MHRINLEKYEVNTDMAVDLTLKDNIKNEYNKSDVKISWIEIKNNEFNKNNGLYVTLEFSDVTDDDYKNKVKNIFKDELKTMLNNVGYKNSMKTCIVGLGNKNSTPDALGSKVSDEIIVTNHLYEMNIDVDKNFSKVISLAPGVTSQTGIETLNYVKSIVDTEKPDLLIVVDALSSNSISRINRSIQITDSGISPGSGVGNKRCEISKKTLNIPVIAIGIPTISSASVIVADTINYMIENYVYNKNFINKKSSKLVFGKVNNKDKKIDISIEDKKTLLGLVGTLSYDEIANLAYEVLTPMGYNLMVTPKEIDFVIDKLSEILSYGINNCLHNL